MPASASTGTPGSDKDVFTDRKTLLKRRAKSINSSQFVSKAQCDDALRVFTELSELDTADVLAHTGRGDCLRMLEDALGAFDCYMAALQIDPHHARALYGCAMVLKGQERMHDAIDYLERALKAEPEFAEARLLLATVYTDLGTCLKVGGRTDQGVLCYSKATEVEGTYAAAFYNLGVIAGERGDAEQALQFYARAVQLQPAYPEAHCNIGVIRKGLGQLSEAVASYEAALASSPNFVLAKNNLAVALTDLGTAAKNAGDAKAALQHYKRALSYNSAHADAYYNLGVAYMEQQKIEKAILNYELAVHFNPAHFEACNNLGAIYGPLDNAEMTMKWYTAALAINPTYFQTNNNLSIIYTTQGMTDQALRCSQIAIASNPMFAEAYNNLGVLYRDLGQLRPAIAAYEQCLAICPTARNAAQNKLLALNYLPRTKAEECTKAHVAWGLEFVQQACAAYPLLATRRAVPMAHAETAATAAVPQAHSAVAMDSSDKDEEGRSDSAADAGVDDDASGGASDVDRRRSSGAAAAAGKKSGADTAVGSSASSSMWGSQPWVVDMREPSEERPLTIGYISPDFFTHSVSYFIEGPLARHDRRKFRIICYAHVPKGGDAKTARFKQMVGEENWRQIETLGPPECAELIARDRVDILVDLAGHTANNRLDVFALRPAPIQMTWIGYPNTTGLPKQAMDYRLTDGYADPPEDPNANTQHHTEELIRMPRSFLCYTPHLPLLDVAPLPAIANGFVTFGTFNGLAKLQEDTIQIYAKVLLAVPNSRLVLKAKPFLTESVRQGYLDRFEAAGIAPSRIALLGLVPHNTNHLTAYSLMDISLDPWPYAGTTTTCEALLMGVPTVTLRGNTHAHNVGTSLLTNTGHPEWVASTAEEYVQKAVELASNIAALAVVRGRLRGEFLAGGVCAVEPFIGELETVYCQLWSRWTATAQEQPPPTTTTSAAAAEPPDAESAAAVDEEGVAALAKKSRDERQRRMQQQQTQERDSEGGGSSGGSGDGFADKPAAAEQMSEGLKSRGADGSSSASSPPVRRSSSLNDPPPPFLTHVARWCSVCGLSCSSSLNNSSADKCVADLCATAWACVWLAGSQVLEE